MSKKEMKHTDTYTKNDIINAVYNEIGYSKKYSTELVEFCFDAIKEKLRTNHNVKISNFGHFILRDKKARIGRNPTTGLNLTIPSKRVVTFRSSVFLKKKV